MFIFFVILGNENICYLSVVGIYCIYKFYVICRLLRYVMLGNMYYLFTFILGKSIDLKKINLLINSLILSSSLYSSLRVVWVEEVRIF